MFFSLVKNNLQVFLISLEILVKMSRYVYLLCYYFIMITQAMLLCGFDVVCQQLVTMSREYKVCVHFGRCILFFANAWTIKKFWHI